MLSTLPKVYHLFFSLFAGSLVFIMACQRSAGTEHAHTGPAINGISFVAANEVVTGEDIRPIQDLGANWVSLMPYGFVRQDKNVVEYNLPWQWWGERDEGLAEAAALARQQGLQVMLKPQVWFRHGNYTGAYAPADSARKAFMNSFRAFVLHYARVAQSLKAGMYCIGTEWHKFVEAEPDFWFSLIAAVKEVYHGQLTYAANWDEYTTVPFWQELDYIGVNAYFPLSAKGYPTLTDLEAGWQPWLQELQTLAAREAKPVVFTEYGYRSIVGNVHRPWESSGQPAVSLANQATAYRALYKMVWHQPWFAGGFAWKWFHNHAERGGPGHRGFSPQNKPAERVIKTAYTNAAG